MSLECIWRRLTGPLIAVQRHDQRRTISPPAIGSDNSEVLYGRFAFRCTEMFACVRVHECARTVIQVHVLLTISNCTRELALPQNVSAIDRSLATALLFHITVPDKPQITIFLLMPYNENFLLESFRSNLEGHANIISVGMYFLLQHTYIRTV